MIGARHLRCLPGLGR
ncbi:hypothetical protein [Enterobacter huaxiensis]